MSETKPQLSARFSSGKINEKLKKRNILGKILLFILFIISGSGFAWSYLKYQQAREQIAFLSTLDGQNNLAQKEVDEILDKVKKLILLPEDQKPVIATIQDAEALIKEQPFYKGAKNGDKVIIYKDRAIIYDPVGDILINMGPVIATNIDKKNNQEKESVPAEKVVKEKIKIEIRNGSENLGKAGELRDSLNSMPDYEVISIGNAFRSNYDETIIVSLTGKNVENLKNELNAKIVSNIPEGEESSLADFLVIVGNK